MKYYQSIELFNPDAGFQKRDVLSPLLHINAILFRNIYFKKPILVLTILEFKKFKHVLPKGCTGNWL